MSEPVRRRLTSANAEYQMLQALRSNRRKRRHESVFLVEGVRNMNAAVAAGWDVEAAITYRGRVLSSWADDLLVKARPTEVLELTTQLFDGLTDRSERPELLLLVRRRPQVLDELVVHDRFVGVVVDRPSSPGNLGTIIRTADAMGADAVLVSGHAADPYDPRCVRATAGSLFAIPIYEVTSPKAVVTWLGASGIRVTVVVADEEGDAQLGKVEISRPVVVVLGNETSGPSRAYRDLADRTVAIPMSGSASSLNVAEASAMFLYEIDRQGRAARPSS